MTERVVNTYNVFVDSSTGRDNNSKGDNYHLHLGNAGITCEAGQYLDVQLYFVLQLSAAIDSGIDSTK